MENKFKVITTPSALETIQGTQTFKIRLEKLKVLIKNKKFHPKGRT
jgi:hypothetical protein